MSSIPNLNASTGSGSRSRRGVRVHACETCRTKKSKCDGTRPICQRCHDLKLVCIYGDRQKKDTVDRNLKGLKMQVAAYEALLSQLSKQLDSSGNLAVQKTLSEFGVASPSGQHPETPPMLRDAYAGQDSDSGSDDDNESITSMGLIVDDINTEDINDPVGYEGKSSDVSMIRRVKDRLERRTSEGGTGSASTSGPGMATGPMAMEWEPVDFAYHERSSTFRLDAFNLTAPGPADPYSIPPRARADFFIQRYFNTVHIMFPIVDKKDFQARYAQMYDNNHDLEDFEPPEQNRFLAIFNLIIAIGQTYGTFLHEDWNEEAKTVFLRARILGALDGGLMFQLANLEQIQMAALSGFYIFANSHINLAWNIMGVLVCMGQSLGLHLVSRAMDLNSDKHELRLRVWHAITYLEGILCTTSGRPSLINPKDCSSLSIDPRKEGVYGYMPVRDTFFGTRQRLLNICKDVVSELYSTSGGHPRKYATTRAMVHGFLGRLHAWKSDLVGAELDFSETHNTGLTDSRTVELALRYQHAFLILYRPCVCVSDNVNLVGEKRDFTLVSARAAVTAARRILSITVDSQTEMTQMPWWCILHLIGAAEGIIMLELTNDSQGACFDIRKELFEEANRAINWLERVAVSNYGARRIVDEFKAIMEQIKVQGPRAVPATQSVIFSPDYDRPVNVDSVTGASNSGNVPSAYSEDMNDNSNPMASNSSEARPYGHSTDIGSQSSMLIDEMPFNPYPWPPGYD